VDPPFQAPPFPPAVDAELCRTIVGLLLALMRAMRGSLTKQALLRLIAHALEQVPNTMQSPLPANFPYLADVPHILTLWRFDRRYLQEGRPRPLPLKGPEPSLQSLIHEVNPRLSFQGTIHVLRSCRLLRRAGHRLYLPKDIMVRTRGTPYQAPQQLTTLAAVLTNFDHNAATVKLWSSWLDQGAECPNFPISKLPEWEDYLFSQSREQLSDYNAFLHRMELSRDPLEPTTRVGIRFLQYERSHLQQTAEFTDTVGKLLASLRTPSTEPFSSTVPSARSVNPSPEDLP
jgi:hypothetical protein